MNTGVGTPTCGVAQLTRALPFEDGELANRRLLVVDDNALIHRDIRKLLAPRDPRISALEREAAELFGDSAPNRWEPYEFEIDSATQGEEGVERIKRSLTIERPYAVAFVDVRMPPGIDGIETARRMWAADPDVQVVLCTAFSDYTLAETIEQLGTTDRLLILKKPYDPIELAMLAISLTEKWNLAHDSRRVIDRHTQLIDELRRELATFRGGADA